MDHYILLLRYLSNHTHFITNGYKRFSKGQLGRSKATCSFMNRYSCIAAAHKKPDSYGGSMMVEIYWELITFCSVPEGKQEIKGLPAAFHCSEDPHERRNSVFSNNVS